MLARANYHHLSVDERSLKTNSIHIEYCQFTDPACATTNFHNQITIERLATVKCVKLLLRNVLRFFQIEASAHYVFLRQEEYPFIYQVVLIGVLTSAITIDESCIAP